jgi:pimeloyl-ACP methyl ester carboxylesterase
MAYRLEDYVYDLDELRQDLGLERIDLLGHSHGGFVAMSYASAHPQRVRRLVLVATGPRFAREYNERIESIWNASEDPSIATARAARSERLSSASLGPADYRRLGRIELRLSFAAAENVPLLGSAFEAEPPNIAPLLFFNRELAPTFDLRPLLPAIRAETLVVTGDHDFFGPPAAADIVAGIEGARQAVLQGAGHYPWIERPAAFAEEVRQFLAS